MGFGDEQGRKAVCGTRIVLSPDHGRRSTPAHTYSSLGIHWREPVFKNLKQSKSQNNSIPKVKVKKNKSESFRKSNKVNLPDPTFFDFFDFFEWLTFFAFYVYCLLVRHVLMTFFFDFFELWSMVDFF